MRTPAGDLRAISIDDSDFILRPTSYRDIDFAWRLYRDAMQPLHAELSDWNEALQRRLIENDLLRGEVSIIAIGGQPAGWIQLRETAQEIGILQLHLKPRLQNRHVGTVIIRRLIHRAWMTKRELYLEAIRNGRVRRLYERLGLITTSEVGQRVRMTLQRDHGTEGPVLPNPGAMRVAPAPRRLAPRDGKG